MSRIFDIICDKMNLLSVKEKWGVGCTSFLSFCRVYCGMSIQTGLKQLCYILGGVKNAMISDSYNAASTSNLYSMWLKNQCCHFSVLGIIILIMYHKVVLK